MSNTSATGGFLTPVGTGPLQAKALRSFIQAWIVGVTGLDGLMVRPRWQQEPPNIPNITEDWCAFGVTVRRPDTFAYNDHHDDGISVVYTTVKQEELTVLCSFYGPNADEYADRLQSGSQVQQNLEYLTAGGFGFVEITDPTAVPELIKDRWWTRIDETLRLRRANLRTYEVLSLAEAQGTLNTDTPSVGPVPIVVKEN